MSKQKISGWLVNTGTVATAVATATLVTGILAPQASAINLVPGEEGQVPMTNSPCLAGNPCVDLHPLKYIYRSDRSRCLRSGARRTPVRSLTTNRRYVRGHAELPFNP